jgi:hypothetical protein
VFASHWQGAERRNEEMALSVFDDKLKKPGKSDLKKALGRASAHWDNLIQNIADNYSPLDETWNFAGADWGWSLRLRQKKRSVLYMTPGKRFFYVGFVLGEKAVKAANSSTLPKSVLTIIAEARKFVEGRAVRLKVRNKKDLEITIKLAAIKMEN